jgi:hypothetical protein
VRNDQCQKKIPLLLLLAHSIGGVEVLFKSKNLIQKTSNQTKSLSSVHSTVLSKSKQGKAKRVHSLS